MKRKPKNTEQDANSRLAMLIKMQLFGTDHVIEQEESDGQVSLINSDTIPAKMNEETKKALTKSGVKFGELVEDDPLFQYVELPEGWTKRPIDRLWTDLLDSRGQVRARLMYKAAFYDRKARTSANLRFRFGTDYESAERGVVISHVRKGNEIVFSSDEYHVDPESRDQYAAMDKADKQCRQWLEKNYPDYLDPSAYWD